MNEDLYKRIKGILIGGAFGDAMGMPTELWTKEMILEEYPKGVNKFEPSIDNGSISRKMKAGQITDDTINTIFLIDMLDKENGKISVANYLEQLKTWSNDSELADLVSGPSTRKALELINQGVSVTETGKFGTTNGAAMKINPIGLISDYHNLAELSDKVHQICMPTHNTSIAISGACGIAAAISYVSSGEKDFEEMMSFVFEAIKIGMKKGYQVSSPSLIRRINYVLRMIDEQEVDCILDYLYNFLGTNVETIDTIPSVFAIVKLAKGNPYQAARFAANLGGDTDTIGAIATSICGGLSPDFDDEVIDFLEEVNQINFDELTNKIIKYSPFYNKM